MSSAAAAWVADAGVAACRRGAPWVSARGGAEAVPSRELWGIMVTVVKQPGLWADATASGDARFRALTRAVVPSVSGGINASLQAALARVRELWRCL